MQAVLSNHKHPEYGVVVIPFPIPREQFDHCVELVEALEISNVSARDCHVDEIRSAWPVLNRLEGRTVNLDELDDLAKRLDSFTKTETVYQGGRQHWTLPCIRSGGLRDPEADAPLAERRMGSMDAGSAG